MGVFRPAPFPAGSPFLLVKLRAGSIGVLFGCFGRNIDGDSCLPGGFLNMLYQGHPSISPKKDTWDFFGPPRPSPTHPHPPTPIPGWLSPVAWVAAGSRRWRGSSSWRRWCAWPSRGLADASRERASLRADSAARVGALRGGRVCLSLF